MTESTFDKFKKQQFYNLSVAFCTTTPILFWLRNHSDFQVMNCHHEDLYLLVLPEATVSKTAASLWN